MKTRAMPDLRLAPEILAQAEAVLHRGETLSLFIEDGLRRNIALRQGERYFLARGLAAGARARETGFTLSSQESIARLKALSAQRVATATHK